MAYVPVSLCPCTTRAGKHGAKLTGFVENYMQNARSSVDPPGALGLGQSTATNIFNAFFLFSFLTPMLFALLSDIYVGRYKALVFGLVYVAPDSSLPWLHCLVLLTLRAGCT
jgi:MFS family permease